MDSTTANLEFMSQRGLLRVIIGQNEQIIALLQQASTNASAGNAALASQLDSMEGHIMSVLDDMEAEVANNTSVEGSVETLIANLVAAAQANATDPVRLQAVLDTMKANDSRLAALVAANTSAASTNPVPPAV